MFSHASNLTRILLIALRVSPEGIYSFIRMFIFLNIQYEFLNELSVLKLLLKFLPLKID